MASHDNESWEVELQWETDRHGRELPEDPSVQTPFHSGLIGHTPFMTLSMKSLNPTLDRIESKLPLVPRRVFRLQRTLAGVGIFVGRSILSTLGVATDRVEASARTGVKTVAGQARAEAEQTAEVAEAEASSALGRATRAIEGESAARLEDWTKAELYERAQELDIEGRSSMSKKQLVTALRNV